MQKQKKMRINWKKCDLEILFVLQRENFNNFFKDYIAMRCFFCWSGARIGIIECDTLSYLIQNVSMFPLTLLSCEKKRLNHELKIAIVAIIQSTFSRMSLNFWINISFLKKSLLCIFADPKPLREKGRAKDTDFPVVDKNMHVFG